MHLQQGERWGVYTNASSWTNFGIVKWNQLEAIDSDVPSRRKIWEATINRQMEGLDWMIGGNQLYGTSQMNQFESSGLDVIKWIDDRWNQLDRLDEIDHGIVWIGKNKIRMVDWMEFSSDGIIVKMRLSNGINRKRLIRTYLHEWNQLEAIDSDESSIKERMESTRQG